MARNEPARFYQLLGEIEEFTGIQYSAEKPFLQLFYRNPHSDYYNGEFVKESAYILLEMPAPPKPKPTPEPKPSSEKVKAQIHKQAAPKTGDYTSNLFSYTEILGVSGTMLIIMPLIL